MSTRSVEDTIRYLIDPWANQTLTFRALTPIASIDGMYMPRDITTQTNGSGAFTIALPVPDDPAVAASYLVVLPSNLSLPFVLSKGTGSVRLGALFVQAINTESPNGLQVLIDAHAALKASTTQLAHVKVDGTTITVDSNGVITAVGGGGAPSGPAGGVLSGTYPNPGFAADMATQAELDAHTGNTSNPHSVTKTQVSLGNVDNTADASKPVSTATQTALDLKAPLASPALTGTPTAPTAVGSTNTTQVATTAFVTSAVGASGGDVSGPLSNLQIAANAVGTPELVNDAVTYAKIQNISATDKVLGRVSSGAGDVEEITLTAAGRALIDDADAAAQRTTLGLGTAATQNTGAFDAAGAASSAVSTHNSDNAAHGQSANGHSLITAADYAAMRILLSLVIGTDVQAQDAELAALAALTSAANKLPYFTGSGTAALTDLTSFIRTLLDDANAATARATLGVDKLTTFSDVDYTALATDKIIAQIGTLSAVRTVTLPAANAVNAGYELLVEDRSATIVTANYITVARAGSDLINGATSHNIRTNYGKTRFISDGVSSWDFDVVGTSRGGTGATTTAAARVNLGTEGRTTVSNANYTVLATDKTVAQTGTLSASRTVTLPAANAVNAGYVLTITDESGTVTSANTLVLARAGSDTINGATSYTMDVAYATIELVSDGSSKWTLDIQGIGRGGTGATTASAARSNLGTNDAANITTGTLGLARGGTNADLSATGGANQIVKQTSVGGALSVATLAAGDLPAATSSAAGSLSASDKGYIDRSRTVQALTDGATINWNMNSGGIATVTLGGNRTIANPTNLVDGESYVLHVTQDGTGSRTLAYGSVYKWAGGTAPTLTTSVAAVDTLTFLCKGSNLHGSILKDFR